MLDVASTPHERLRGAAAAPREHGPSSARSGSFADRVRSAGTPPGSAIAALYRASDERLLAIARLIAAFVLCVATVTDSDHTRVVELLVGVYALHSAVIFVAIRFRPEWLLARATALHGVDIVWTTIATTLSGGTGSHIFPFFAFVLLSSAFRWGLAGTLRDSSIILFVGCSQGAAAAAGLTPWPFHVDVFVVRAAYIGVGVALLFGALSDRQYELRFQALAIADLAGRITRTSRFGAAVRQTLGEVVRLFGARLALLVVEDTETNALFLWRAEARSDGRVGVNYVPLRGEDRALWLVSRTSPACRYEVRRDIESGRVSLSIALDVPRLSLDVQPEVPVKVAAASMWKVLITVPVYPTGVWRGQLYLLDPERKPRGELSLRFLDSLARQIGPALLNLHLLRRLRSRAESLERARLSRELHNGSLQSLAALEMRLEVLRRRAESMAPTLTGDLAQIRDLLHNEAVTVREIMYSLRPAHVDAARLRDELADLVERFSRSSGVEGRLDWAVDRLPLAAHQCREIVRVVQEALINVRQYSAATRVRVRIEADACAWGLIVEDNGRGLGFAGELSHEQLQAQGRGPRAIRQRVALLGGTLDVTSSAQGTRLEMTFPKPEHG